MRNVLGQVLTTFAEDEGRDAASTAPDPGLKFRHLRRLIARRRAVRIGAISLSSVVVLAGIVAGSSALINLNNDPVADGGLNPIGVSTPTGTPNPTATEASTPSPSPSAGAATDELTCTGFGDVLTVIQNADAGLSDGRMEAQEQDGWYRLATRVLGRTPTRGEGAVSDAIDALKEVAPAIPLGVIETTGVGSAEWEGRIREVVSACADSGAEVMSEGFTGG